MPARGPAPKCSVCDGEGASPHEGHKTPMCATCFNDWEGSREYAVMVGQRQSFIDRRRKELAK